MKKQTKIICAVVIAILLILGGIAIVISLNKKDNTKNGDNEVNNQVTVYVFHGNTCPACKNAIKNFTEKKDTVYKDVEFVTYELWLQENREVNNKLMELVANKLDVDAEYIPFIVIGGFSTTGYEEKKILKEIEKAKKDPNYQDVVKKILEENKDLQPNSEEIKSNANENN